MQMVQANILPFYADRKTLQVPEGLTLHEIVKAIFPKNIQGLEIVVCIKDEVIPKRYWKQIKPKMHTLVGVNVVAAGGGGKKNPLVTILTIAVAIAAPYLANVYGVALGSAMFGGGVLTAGQIAIAKGIITIGVGLIGTLATSMLSSTPRQRNAESVSESPTQFIEGASNQINKFGVIPINLGVNRVFPFQAALPYTETSGNDQYVRQLFTYGYGNLIISERKFGETLISEYEGVDIEDRLDADLHLGTSLYSNDVYQEGLSVLLENSSGYILRTSQENTDEVEIDLTFQNGLTSYNDQGNRTNRTVQFSVQFAPTGTSDWSNGESGLSVSSQVLTVPSPVRLGGIAADNNVNTNITKFSGIIVLDLTTGVAKILVTTGSTPQPVPSNHIRIGSYVTNFDRSITTITDERASFIPSQITSGSFVLSSGGTTITVGSGTLVARLITLTDSTSQAVRISRRYKLPNRGQYDVRIKRMTADSTSDRIRDQATWSALKSITHINPVNQTDISGSAIRIKASDQLSGSIDRFNVICQTIISYWTGNEWVEGVSSNPAAIYRFVLQSDAFVKRLPDSRIDIDALQEWSEYCDSQGLTYNRYIDYDASVDEILNDIAAAGMATPHKVDGVYSVIVDNERPIIKGMVTPRNCWGYKGSITYPELPHALRVQFRNKNQGYNLDERIVYADGYDSSNATIFERLEFSSCTDPELAWYYGRRYLATGKLQPESHAFNMDFENLTFTRGDRIVFVNDSILVGVGQGRIKELIDDGLGQVTGFVLDDMVEIPTTSQFGVRVRQADGSDFTYYSLTTTVGLTDTFTLATPVDESEAPLIGSLCAFTEFGKELDLLVTDIRMNKDHSASITAVNYAPERFTATTGAIPNFSSNITLPLGFYAPEAPVLGGLVQSDESVMLRNSDGSYISRMIIPLVNQNETSVIPIVMIQRAGATQWQVANLLGSGPNQVEITGLVDGASYNVSIRYQRQSGQMLLSQPLVLNGVVYIGASSLPADVETFKVSASDSTGLFEWLPSQDVDFSHYVIRFTRLTTGATWVNSQIVADNIKNNRISLPIQSGTYLLKAVDILGNESANAATVISFNDGALLNVVENLIQQPLWEGVHDNTVIDGDDIILDDYSQVGYYYFDPAEVDLSEVYESFLSSSIQAFGDGGGSDFYIRTISSVRAVSSIRGVDISSWKVTLQMNLDDSGWVDFLVGNQVFQTAKFRLKLESFVSSVTPRVSRAEVEIDMPDRSVKQEDVLCPSTGVTITYDPPFKNNPAVNITLQDGAVDDRLEYVSKTATGFTIKVYNATAAAYVERTFDFNAVGYGRVI